MANPERAAAAESTRAGGALGDGGGDDHEFARHAIAAPLGARAELRRG